MLAEPQGAAETGPGPLAGPGRRLQRVVGQEAAAGGARTATGPTPGPPPPCGMQNVLCRFRCETSAPNWPGLREADERVQVGAVDVDLPARVVHEPADLADRALVHAVRRGVGDHQRRDVLGVLGELRAQVVEVDVAELVAGHDDDAHAGHHGARGVRAVRARRDQADVALRRRRARGGSRGSRAGPANSPCEPAFGCSETAS